MNQRLYQAKGSMIDARNLFVAVGGGEKRDYKTYRNKLAMYAVEISKFIQPSEVGNNKERRSVDFYNYDLAVRYHHMFLVMPGGLEDDIGGVLDYDKIKVAIFDVRTKDEVMRWPMEDCGNGNYNATAFEECDYARKPPAYDHSYRTAGDVFYWGESYGGDGNYYTCNDICLRQPIGLCGDGI